MERVGFAAISPRPPATGQDRVRYEDDAYTWARQQAALLRAGRFEQLDVVNLAAEIEDVGNREYDKLESALTRVLQHLLKWDHQAERRSRFWALSIREHRRRVIDQLADCPGLKSKLDQAIARGYHYGRLEALRETELAEDELPQTNPYAWTEIAERAISWPDDQARATSA